MSGNDDNSSKNPESEEGVADVVWSAAARTLKDILGGMAIFVIILVNLLLLSIIAAGLSYAGVIEIVEIDLLNITFIMYFAAIMVLFVIWVSVAEYSTRFQNRIENVGRTFWKATTDEKVFSEPYDEKGAYQEYQYKYVDYFSQLAPIGVILFLTPLPFTLGSYGRVNLQLLAGSYLLTAVLLQGRANTLSTPINGTRSDVWSDVKHQVTVHYEIVFLLLAGIAQTAASLGARTEELLGFATVVGSALVSVYVGYIFFSKYFN